MNSNNRKGHDKNRTKATGAVAVTMAPAIVTAAILLSGLSLIGSYHQPVLAQQAMTESVGTTGAGGGTTGGGTVCILITSNGATAGNTTTPTTTDAAAQGGNATTSTVGEAGAGNQPEGGFDIGDAITAFQNNGTQGVMNSLDLADKTLGGAGLIQDNNNVAAAETAAGDVTNMTTTVGAP